MSEIEKMYKNAGITKIGNKKCTPAEFLDCQNYCFISENNKCDKYSYDYSPFTAEKQLELIKWIAYKTHVTIGKGLPWGQYDDDWWTVTSKKGYTGTNAYKLEEALANFINSLWQSLTEEEKQQIKEILGCMKQKRCIKTTY